MHGIDALAPVDIQNRLQLMQDGQSYVPAPDKAADAYTRIKAAIYRYRSPSGVFLNIRNIAARLRVSPTPVREALIKLAIEDVIGFILRRGYYVKALDVGDLGADYEMAMVLVKYSVESGAISTIETMPRSLKDLSPSDRRLKDPEVEIVAEYIEGLYDRIVRLSANRRFILGMHQFNARTSQIRRFRLTSAPPDDHALADLHRLEEAIKAGRRDAAVQIIGEQYRRTIAALPSLVKGMNLRAKNSRTSLEELL